MTTSAMGHADTPQLGLGLLSIGRRWGYRESEPPPEAAASRLLARALELGIRVFDTAPSYGRSEAILGSFLQSVTSAQLHSITVATKFGEHWNSAAGSPFTDFSYSALARSIDHSLSSLGRIDVLQLHKADLDVLRNPDVRRALEYARAAGILRFGASVRDLETATAVLQDPWFEFVQLPFNSAHPAMEPAIKLAFASGKQVLINRPLAMGALLYSEGGGLRGEDAIIAAYEYILRKPFRGAILTGTASVPHLEQNVRAFRQAKQTTTSY